MKLALLCALLGLLPPTLLAMADGDVVPSILGAVLGGGGVFGAVRYWMHLRSKNEERDDLARAQERANRIAREERQDLRLDRLLAAARDEREKDREKERLERERASETAAETQREISSTFRDSTKEIVSHLRILHDEVRGMREDQRAGAACRLADLPRPEAEKWLEARPIAKKDGTRGG